MSIASNVTGRELGEQVFSLLSELIRDEDCDSESKARAWRVARDMIDQVIGNEPDALGRHSEARSAMSADEADVFGDRACPFKAHKGKPYDEVPADYLRWICDENVDLLRYVEFRENEEFQDD